MFSSFFFVWRFRGAFGWMKSYRPLQGEKCGLSVRPKALQPPLLRWFQRSGGFPESQSGHLASMPLHEADRSQWRLFAGRAQYPSDGLSDEELLLLQLPGFQFLLLLCGSPTLRTYLQ